MRVRYPGPSAAVDLPGPDGTPLRVKRNHSVDVPDEMGASLVEQGWSQVRTRPPKKTESEDAPAEVPADDEGDA